MRCLFLTGLVAACFGLAGTGAPAAPKIAPKVWLTVTSGDPMTESANTNFSVDFTWAPPCNANLQWSLWASAPGGLIWLNGGTFDTSAMTGSDSLPLNIPATGMFYVRFGSGDLERWVTITVQ